MNTDQGHQFTSDNWRECLEDANITISMDGKRRWLDNVVIERVWRGIKYEDIYLKPYESPRELEKGIGVYILRYHNFRPYQSISNATPNEVKPYPRGRLAETSETTRYI